MRTAALVIWSDQLMPTKMKNIEASLLSGVEASSLTAIEQHVGNACSIDYSFGVQCKLLSSQSLGVNLANIVAAHPMPFELSV